MRPAFFLDSNWTFLNHGAFGAVAKTPFLVADAWRRYAEEQPLRFMDRELLPALVHSIREFAPFVGARPCDLVLLPNATTGLNAVLNATLETAEDEVLVLDLVYGSTKKIHQATVRSKWGPQSAQQHLISLPVRLPADPEHIIEQVRDALSHPGHRIRVAIFDHITSNTALELPVVELAALCRKAGVAVLIDGAHTAGQIPLNISAIKPDFYVGNCHKWLCCPRGSGFLWVAENWQKHIAPPVMSHGYGAGFLSEFIWDGARDYSALLALPAALEFWRSMPAFEPSQNLTGSVVTTRSLPHSQHSQHSPLLLPHMAYIGALQEQASSELEAAWGVVGQGIAPTAMHAAMALVRLPESLYAVLHPKCFPFTSTEAKIIQDALHDSGIEVPVKAVQGHLYVRTSAHVYNELEDYYKLMNGVHLVEKNLARS